MMKYRKKPVVVEAIQYLGRDVNLEEVKEFATNNSQCAVKEGWFAYTYVIETLEGDMSISPGDYIIKGVKNEFYPCKPDIFEATYELVD